MIVEPYTTYFNPFRVIPILLVNGSGMVKTRRFRKPRYLGDILNGLRIFNEKQVDEIAIIDIDAARTRRPPNMDLITELASECFMPLAYGGGIETTDQANGIIRAGVEKVILNTAAFQNTSMLCEIARTVGSQSVVAGLDVKRGWFDRALVMTRSATRRVHRPLKAAITLIEDAGAGEILLQAVDRDGTQSGYDISLIRSVTEQTSLPVIAAGGASSTADLVAAINEGGASAVAAGALFVYHGPHQAVLINYPASEEIHQIMKKAEH